MWSRRNLAASILGTRASANRIASTTSGAFCFSWASVTSQIHSGVDSSCFEFYIPLVVPLAFVADCQKTSTFLDLVCIFLIFPSRFSFACVCVWALNSFPANHDAPTQSKNWTENICLTFHINLLKTSCHTYISGVRRFIIFIIIIRCFTYRRHLRTRYARRPRFQYPFQHANVMHIGRHWHMLLVLILHARANEFERSDFLCYVIAFVIFARVTNITRARIFKRTPQTREFSFWRQMADTINAMNEKRFFLPLFKSLK